MTTKTADPIHILRNRNGRSIDLRPIIGEMRLMQNREHWRDEAVRIQVEAWRLAIVRDTGFPNAPVELAERLAEHLSPPFARHLLQTWARVTGKEKKGKKANTGKAASGPPANLRLIAKVYHIRWTTEEGEPIWCDAAAGFTHYQRKKLGYWCPPEQAAVLITEKNPRWTRQRGSFRIGRSSLHRMNES
jgi:hypothetical protein